LAAHPLISTKLAAVRQLSTNRVVLTRAWVLERLMQHADVCLGRSMIKLSLRNRKGEIVESEMHRPHAEAANKALELLGKEAGMFIDRTEVGAPGEFAKLSDSELGATLLTEAKRLGFSQVAAMIEARNTASDAEVVPATVDPPVENET